MSLQWIHENPPRWDATKVAIIGEAPDGIFRETSWSEGDLIPGEWWRVERDGETVGYGWMEYDWAEAEILLAVAPDAQGGGVGSFILDKLEDEAAERGLNYLYNTVRDSHPRREAITRWLEARRFAGSHDSDRLVRRVARTAEGAHPRQA